MALFGGKKTDSAVARDDEETLLETTHVHAARVGRATVVRLRCETIGSYESGILANEITEALKTGPSNLVIDLSQVGMLASAGLGMLVKLNAHVQALRGRFAVCGLSEEIMEVMRITRMHKLFTIEKDLDAALKAVG